MPLPSELLDAIPGSNPAGVSVRYEPVFDQIKLARLEEVDAPQGEWKRARKTADYVQVIKLASDVLARQSKDLQVAAWLAEALLYREGFAGLLSGLRLIRDLLDRYWDHLYPELEDGDAELRAAPLEWVGRYLDVAVRLVPLSRDGLSFVDYKVSRTVVPEAEAKEDSDRMALRRQAVEEGKVTPEEWDEAFASTPKEWYRQLVGDLDAALAELQELGELCDARFEDAAPSFIPLRESLREVRQLAGQLLSAKLAADPDPVEAPAVVVAPEAADPAPAAEAPRAGGAPAAGPPSDREDAAARLASIARFLRQQDPTDPSPYLMLRGFRWGELRAGGESPDPKLLPAPATDIRVRLKSLLLAGEWAELLDCAEAVMSTPFGRGWLELQRYVVTACEALGGGHLGVAHAVRGAVRGLLEDFPRLPFLTLMDDSPTANAETRQWLAEAGLLRGGEDGSGERGPADAVRLDHLRGGAPERGIEALMREAERARSPRERFLRRSQAAQLMVEAGLERVAMPLLYQMIERIDAHRLEEWETGETVATPIGLLYRSLVRLDEGAHNREELYQRVCRLDPLQAMRIAAEAGREHAGG